MAVVVQDALGTLQSTVQMLTVFCGLSKFSGGPWWLLETALCCHLSAGPNPPPQPPSCLEWDQRSSWDDLFPQSHVQRHGGSLQGCSGLADVAGGFHAVSSWEHTRLRERW